MDKNKSLILPSKEFYNSPNSDLNIRVDLEEQKNLLREGDRTIILDQALLFDKERNESINYKIHGKLKMVFRNLYYGESFYPTLEQNLYLYGDGSYTPTGFTSPFIGYLPYDEFAFLRTDVYRESSQVYGTDFLGGFVPNIVITGSSSHMNITPIEAPYHNWNIYLSYVFSGDTNFPLGYTLSGGTIYNFNSGDGIPFRVNDNGTTYQLISPVPHNISAGEYIIISGGTLDFTVPISGRTFVVVSVGNNYYNSEKYVLDISKSELPSGTTLSTVVLGKRCLDKNDISGTTSTYYVHKHKTLTTINDYILDKLSFESPIWRDEKKVLFQNSAFVENVIVERNRMESLIYDFKNTFSLSGLTNNLGYLPTDVYVTVIFVNKNGYFDYPPKVGFKFNFHDTWIDEYFDGSSTIETSIPTSGFSRTVGMTTYNFTSGLELPLDTILTGAFVEYNNYELKETIISESFHKLTNPTFVLNYGQTGDTTNFTGATSTNPFGFYYQPHYRVKLRQLSPYIETSTTNQVYGLPQNAKYFSDENLWKWRDLYDHGYIDPDGFGTNFPFMNGTHYVKNDINFYLRNEEIYTNKQDGIKNVTKFTC